MSFQIIPITDKKLWDKFLTQEKPHTFLQSWEWGEFNQADGNKIWRLGIFEERANKHKPAPCLPDQTAKYASTIEDNLLATALIIKIKARRGSFLFCPHGPIASLKIKNHPPIRITKIKNVLQCLTDYLKNLSQAEGCSFIRISSLEEKSQSIQELFNRLGFRPAPIHMHSENAWLLNLRGENNLANEVSVSKTKNTQEVELFSSFRKTHRNLIRKAKRLGVEIITSTALSDLIIFNQLYRLTVKRQKFTPFSFDYLKKEFEIFKKENKVLIFLARYKNQYLSGAIIIFDANSAFYHHGASARKYSNIPASYLVQWSAILEAVKRGLKFYNFWGIAPAKAKNHPWAGLTLFKQGFGGFSEQYLPAQDLVLKSSYWLTYLIEKIRKWRRRL